MNKMIGVFVVSAMTCSYALAQDIVISTGREGGTYFGIQGPKIVKFIKGAGLSASFVSSSGSLDNLTKVAKGETQVGIAQADSIMFYKKTNPQLGVKIEIGGTLGEECVFIVVKRGGKIHDDSNLQVKGVTVAIGSPGDGSRATWDYMGVLEEKFKNPTPSDMGGASGLSQVVTGAADAFVFVTNPDKTLLFNNELFTLAQNNRTLQFVPITDWNLNDKLPNGDAVYSFKKVAIKEGFLNDYIDTICMNTYTIYNGDLSPEVKEKISRAFLRMSADDNK